MRCPNCGNTDLIAKFKWCPECGCPLPSAQNIPSKIEHGIVPTTVQQSHSSTRHSSDLDVDNRHNQENQQQDVDTTEREQPQSSTGQHPGPTQQPNKDYVGSVPVQPDEKPTEERAGLSENDQRPEYTPPTVSDQGHEDAVGSKGAGVINTTREATGNQTDLSDVVPSATTSTASPLEEQAERTSGSMDPHRGNVAPGGDTTVTASSTSDTTKDEAVRGPAVLEGSEILKSSETRDAAATKITGNTASLGSGSKTEGSQTYAQVTGKGSSGPVTRLQAAKNGGNRNQSNATSSSVPGRKTETVSQHPLGKPGKVDGVRETNEEEGGTWYRKSDNEQQETKGSQKSKKNQKKEEKGKSNAEQQPGQQPSTTQPFPPSLQQVNPEAGVTVMFHVLLASNFKMTDESLFIRAYGAELGDFEHNCVDMNAVEVVKSKDKDRLVLFRGQFTISLDRARKGTFYKYVVVKKGKVHWEDLLEFPPGQYYGIVNRYLKIPDKHIEPGATLNQFDGVAYVYGEQSMLEKFKSYLSKDKTLENQAVMKLENVVNCLSNVQIEESGYHRQRQPINFDVRKALSDLLKPKMEENIAILTECQVGSSDHVSAVVSSLAIILLVKKHKIELKREEVKSLLCCLSLEADRNEKRCSTYEALLAEFSTGLRGIAVDAIESLCNQLMKHAWTSNPNGFWQYHCCISYEETRNLLRNLISEDHLKTWPGGEPRSSV
ncbi:hypothetical protein OS493_005761 [Desmophyllum pertusum]|uniref:Uncharacterized protein n=1 Tax=Desmophyllum pertusum TaxID=174260 RepID=A0A9X0CFS5_9CNID|nr:hypothetical protein OS493_005761 [Desmophyllum pertusum]